MTLDNDIAVLAGTELFGELTQEQLRLLAFGAERMRFNSGRTIFREGDKADCAYVVAQGRVALFRQVRGQTAEAGTAGPGSLIGDMALITATERDRTALADDDVEILRINRSLFQRMLSEYPELAVDMHERLSERLRLLLKEIAVLDRRFSALRDI